MIHVHRFAVGSLSLAVVGAFGWLLFSFPLGFLGLLLAVFAYSIGQALIDVNKGRLSERDDLPPPPPPESL